jgi:hypothetical protein
MFLKLIIIKSISNEAFALHIEFSAFIFRIKVNSFAFRESLFYVFIGVVGNRVAIWE